MDVGTLLAALGVAPALAAQGELTVTTPIDGSVIGRVRAHTAAEISEQVARALRAFAALRAWPAPKRGELIRLFAGELRAHKPALGELVTIESGKIREEGLGEVQEMIDVCDFAVGLSRQLHGLTIASERPDHRMMEQWHPLGPAAVISAWNFPAAVWAWNFALAIVCGDPVIWKPSEKTPLTALACAALFARAVASAAPPADVCQIVLGERAAGEQLAADARVALVSATGSCAMGRAVAPAVAARFGRALLELGGNNAMVVAPSADLDLAVRAILFSAVGTAGQRCTSLRRLLVHDSVRGELLARLQRAFPSLPVGSPLEQGVLVGPLIDQRAFTAMQRALAQAAQQGGRVLYGGARVLLDRYPHAFYVQPAIVELPAQTAVMHEETFAPILYAVPYHTLEQAIELNNAVPQGLSSCIFTLDVREAERFVSASGSDCGIANVNLGPSGAEIGGAFGGEKATGGGRESGSDCWKNYMRRATNTINYGETLPLAQGIRFA